MNGVMWKHDHAGLSPNVVINRPLLQLPKKISVSLLSLKVLCQDPFSVNPDEMHKHSCFYGLKETFSEFWPIPGRWCMHCITTQRISCCIWFSWWVVPSLLEVESELAPGQICQRSGNILYYPEMGLIQSWNKTPPASGMLFYQITSNWPLLPIKANGHTN